MRLIIAGGRDYPDDINGQTQMLHALATLDIPFNTELITGMARGADRCAFRLWKNRTNNLIHEMPADWDTYGKSAGYRRNTEMAALADALIAFWDGKSRGTKHMIETMQRLGKPVHVFPY